MNVAAVIADGEVAGVVPKSYLPNYREFYEARHFRRLWASGPGNGRNLMARTKCPSERTCCFDVGEAVIAIEVCEDFWTPMPPSSQAAVSGANVLVNLSASNETIGKAAWRRDLVTSQSGRCIAAYAYVSAGSGRIDIGFGLRRTLFGR